MNSPIFEICQGISEHIFDVFSTTGTLEHSLINPKLGLNDYYFHSDIYRKAHISIIDAKEKHNLWLLHVTIFPKINDDSPIYGFDIIAGPNKVSGAFHDFSSCGNQNHHMLEWFHKRTFGLEWNRPRPLPEWAQKIFSKGMVAIGAVRENELKKFVELGIETLSYYVNHVGPPIFSAADYSSYQNFYCEQQRLNPHTPKVLVNLGFTVDEAQSFVNEILFPYLDT